MKKKTQKPRTFDEVYASVRRDWGNVKPITRVFRDERRKSRQKTKEELRKGLFLDN